MTQHYEFTTTVLRHADMRLHTVLAQDILKPRREIQLSRITVFPDCHSLLEVKNDTGVSVTIQRFVAVDTSSVLLLDMTLVHTMSLQQSSNIVGSLHAQALINLRRTRFTVGSTDDSCLKAVLLDNLCHLLDIDELSVLSQLMGANLKEEIDRRTDILLTRLDDVEVFVGSCGG